MGIGEAQLAKFLKRNIEQPSEASVTSIPVPPADSALVIDLPEGQKLVLGKMEEGTVIEVATWRGTGRPDSRTNRLMLGVSFGGNQTSEEANHEEKTQDLSLIEKVQFQIKKVFPKVTALAKEIVSKFFRMIFRIKSLFKKKVSKNPSKFEKNYESTELDSLGDLDIDKWLDSVRSNSRVSRLSASEPSGRESEGELNTKSAKNKRLTAKSGQKRKPQPKKRR